MNLKTTLQSTRTALTAVAVAVVAAACLGASATTSSAPAGRDGTNVTHATKEYKSRSQDVTVATKEYKVVQATISSTKEY
jgi:ABC-type glycerol-3-phosphate transport system substrate-binding protein